MMDVRAHPRDGRVAWSLTSLPPYPVITAFVVISLVGLLLSSTIRMKPEKKDSEYTKINSFFARYIPSTTSNPGDEVQTITKSGNYFDATIPMDGKIRVDAEGKGSAVFPPPFGSSHASNIIALPDTGDLLCAWFSGDAEGGDGVAIVVARLPSGSDQWSEPKVVSQAKDRSAQNPVMFVNREGMVNLLHTSQEAFQGQGTSEVRRVVSPDGGVTWSRPATLFKTPGAFVKNQVCVYV